MKLNPPRTSTADPTGPAVDGRLAAFRQAREARRASLVEDYVELIGDLHASCGEVRQVDLAARLGVAQPTVAKMLRRLADDGLVDRQPYRSATLTALGAEVAQRSRARHRLVERFLVALGVPEPIALRDAEGLEHHVSRETLDAFARYLADEG